MCLNTYLQIQTLFRAHNMRNKAHRFYTKTNGCPTASVKIVESINLLNTYLKMESKPKEDGLQAHGAGRAKPHTGQYHDERYIYQFSQPGMSPAAIMH